jgi:hypothetical protein
MRNVRCSGMVLAVVLAAQGSGVALGQTITGDLDGNHEVSLSDVTGFVACLSGPDTPSLDPLCVAAMFDDDDDVDLRDVAGFQNRFGFGVGPPRIDRFWPPPGEWIVDDVGLTEVRIGFTEPVIVPDGSIEVWMWMPFHPFVVVSDFTTVYDEEEYVLTVAFAEPLQDHRVTIIVDYLIEDFAGDALDGEIRNPDSALLPSGNGANGGQGVFRVNVLQGDANRDGSVDASDLALINASLGLCSDDPGFNPSADLNLDGCVDKQDVAIAAAAFGRELVPTDGSPPVVEEVEIEFYPLEDEFCVFFRFSQQIKPEMLRLHQCFLVNNEGSVLIPWFANTNGFANTADFCFVFPLNSCENYLVNLSNALQDFSGEFLQLPEPMSCP